MIYIENLVLFQGPEYSQKFHHLRNVPQHLNTTKWFLVDTLAAWASRDQTPRIRTYGRNLLGSAATAIDKIKRFSATYLGDVALHVWPAGVNSNPQVVHREAALGLGGRAGSGGNRVHRSDTTLGTHADDML